jgi:hypothetical protein
MRLFLICLTFIALFFNDVSASGITPQDRILKRAYRLHQSEIQVRFTGKVIVLLPTDEEGSRHQRFIVELASGQTLLIADNIDLAPVVSGLRKGSKVSVRGEYIWGSEGGIVHYTHDDPDESHPSGWIKFKGRKYH